MRFLVRSLAATTSAFLLAGAPGYAQGGDHCIHESLSVDGAPIAATFCVPTAPAAKVTVAETFARGAQSLTRSLPLEVVNGATVTRAIDDVPLTELGSTKLLHLTLAYRNGAIALEHALLLPGAVVLK